MTGKGPRTTFLGCSKLDLKKNVWLDRSKAPIESLTYLRNTVQNGSLWASRFIRTGPLPLDYNC